MSSLKISLPFRACSFQQGHMRYKTPKQEAFSVAIVKEIFHRSAEFAAFFDGFDPKTDVLVTRWVFIYKNFFTKKDGTVSQQTLDLDNSIKNVQDEFFKAFKVLNDSQVVHTECAKWEGDEDEIIFAINIMKRDEFKTYFKEFKESLLL